MSLRNIESVVTTPMNDLRIAVNRDWRTGDIEIQFVRYDLAARTKQIAVFGPMTFVPMKEGDQIPRDTGIRIPVDLESPFLQAMQEALESSGSKPKAQERMEGELQAKDAHLNDLRILLKLKKPS